MDSSIKNSIRNFSGKSNQILQTYNSIYDSPSMTLSLTRMGKMLEESVMKFTRRYLIISTELEEMKRELIGNINIVNEFINLTKKEIRFDKFDNFTNTNRINNVNNIPLMPNYENKSILHGIKKENQTSYNKLVNTKRTKNIYKNPEKKFAKKPSFTTLKDLKKTHQKKLSQNNLSPVRKSLDSSKDLANSRKNTFPNNNHSNNINISNNFNNYNNINGNKNFNKKNEILNLLPDNKTKSLFLLINNNVLDYDEKIKLLFSKKSLLSVISPNELLQNELNNINYNIKELKSKNNLKNNEKNKIENIIKFPSKIAIEGLNYLNSKNEEELMQNENNNLILIKMILICLNEKTDNLNINNINEYYNMLFNKYKVNSIKDLFYKVIYEKIYNQDLNNINKELNKKIMDNITENKPLITDILVNNSNKTFSCVAFSLDEISDYLKEINDLDPNLINKLNIEKNIQNLCKKQELINNKLKNF